MPYITKNNAQRMISRIDISAVSDLEGKVYKKPIYFLAKWEEKFLLLMQSFYKDPEKFVTEIYKPVINKDTYHYVYENENQPAYHEINSCEKLLSSFKNFVIPEEIRERARISGGEEKVVTEVMRFREWFSRHKEFYENDLSRFLFLLDRDWGVQRDVKEIEIAASGAEQIENYSLAKLELEIDSLLTVAGGYFLFNPTKQSIISRFQKVTFLGYSQNIIANNDTGLSDEELKEFLRYYDTRFKKPVKKLLIEYYRVKYNPNLKFEGWLLEKLNFRPCSNCSKKVDN